MAFAPVEFLLDLLTKGDLQLTDRDGNTPLHLIAELHLSGGKLTHLASITDRIISIDGGLSANTKNNIRGLPLISASQSWDSLPESLLNATKDLDAQNSYGHSALQKACFAGQSANVSYFLATNLVDVTKRNHKSGITVLSSVIGETYSTPFLEVLKLLHDANPALAYLCDDSLESLTPLHHALKRYSSYHQGGKQVLVFLLSLPELDKLIVEFMKANVSDTTERLRKLLKFATEKKLEDAVVVIRRYLPDTE